MANQSVDLLVGSVIEITAYLRVVWNEMDAYHVAGSAGLASVRRGRGLAKSRQRNLPVPVRRLLDYLLGLVAELPATAPHRAMSRQRVFRLDADAGSGVEQAC